MGDFVAPRPPDEHVSQLVFDRLLAGEVEGLSTARQHLQQCAVCQQKLEALQAQQQQALQMLPQRVDRLMQAIESERSVDAGGHSIGARVRSWLRGTPPAMWGVRGLAAAAVAVALVWLLLPPATHMELPGQDAVRLKGPSGKLELLLIEGELAAVLRPGQRLAPGSRLGFRAHCPAGCWAMLFMRDQRGRVAILEGNEPAPWKVPKAGEPTALPLQVELDASGPHEQFIALLCRHKPARKSSIRLVTHATARSEGTDQGRASSSAAVPPGCVIRQRVVLRGGASR